MAEVLRVATPVTTSNPSALNVGNAQTPEKIGATRVAEDAALTLGPDGKPITARTYDAGSVFQTFANRITETPDLSQTLQKLLLGVLTSENAEAAGVTENGGVPVLLHELAQKLNMSESDILQNILFQKDQSTGFSSGLFDVLRDITQTDTSAETTTYIGRFLKALDSFNNSGRTMDSIMTQLNNILDRMPRTYAENIKTAMGELIMEPNEQGLESNLQVLKETILPMLGKYVSTTNDLGAVRDRIQMLTQDLSRLNLSGKEELAERFTELLDYAKYNLNLPSDKLASLKQLYAQVTERRDNPRNEFIDSLAKALTSKEGLSTTSQSMVNDTINSLLLNRSVYMPFNHILLPFMLDGNFMFTEMWVEKDGKNAASGTADDSALKRVYLNFDIQGLGKFQAAIGLSGDNVIDCLVNYPESIADSSEDIETDLAKIFTNNGFTVNSVKSSVDSFKTELEILHKIQEGRSSVDVTV